MSNILIYVGAILIVCLIAKLLSAPLKLIWKLLINALIGGICLILVNFIGGFFQFHIDINFITALVAGVLGLPGIVILFILQML